MHPLFYFIDLFLLLLLGITGRMIPAGTATEPTPRMRAGWHDEDVCSRAHHSLLFPLGTKGKKGEEEGFVLFA